ncbi:DNA translocase FtsK 4TM domain-containing protein [Rhodobacteraceae bacterium XHP0102]|nr:DNA translocase FtsK 4TM domain-containing protein [Rhodobacteraceae bacterium XHP0102]
MAYQTRQRDPLLDAPMQEALERRGKELLGLILLAAGVAVAAMLVSYTPDDPNWMVATDTPPENLLGRLGASMSAIFIMIVGYAAYLVAAGLVVWGLRLTLHKGTEGAVARLIMLPFAIAVLAVFIASFSPSAAWPHSFGMGGLFGDTVMAVLINILPVSAPFAMLSLGAATGLGSVLLMGYALGITRAELRLFTRGGLIALFHASSGATGLAAGLGRGVGRGIGRGIESGIGQLSETARKPSWRGRLGGHDGSLLIEDEVPDTFAQSRSQPALQSSVETPVRKPEAQAGLFDRMPLLRAIRGEDRGVAIDAAPAQPDENTRLREKISIIVRSRAGNMRPQALHVTEGVPNPAKRVPPPLTAAAMAQTPSQLVGEIYREVPNPSAPQMADPRLSHSYDFDADDDDQDNIFLDGFQDEDEAFSVSPHHDDYTPLTPMRAEMGAKRVVQHSPKKSTAPSRQAMADAQPSLALEARDMEYEFPPLSLLSSPTNIERFHLSDEALEENARMLENVLDDYGVKGEIVSVRPGPVVTMYELEPAPGLKASRVIGLADDIARSMSALSARVSTVPGRSVIGIELPNSHREKVVLREILSSRDFGDGNHKLPLALGKEIGGEPVVANLAKMPHLLIAGTTGSGKSVAINTMILSLLYKLRPEECRMIMIDPKMLELSVYDGIPHLLSPVVTDPKKAVVALKWVVGEMEERYRKMSKMGVRNIEGYNGRVRDALSKGEMFKRTVQTGFDEDTGEPIFETEEFKPEVMPFIVVIVDEMADLMMVAGKEIEACIQRLAQMARASGIHLIMATQRPSVDVITGTIKANFPTRISFHVTSKIDSRTILGEMGAEQLLGMGDMLYMAGGSKITRVHGPFVSDEEVEEIVRHLKSFGPPAYAASVLDGPDEDKESDIDLVLGLGGNTDGEDALYDQAVAVVVRDRKCSTSYIQRKLGIGYNKAARLVEQMEEAGLVSPANHVGKREILVPEQG